MFVRIPFLTDVTAKKEPFFFFFKNIKIVSNNFLPKVFLHSNANPIVKQDIFKNTYYFKWEKKAKRPNMWNLKDSANSCRGNYKTILQKTLEKQKEGKKEREQKPFQGRSLLPFIISCSSGKLQSCVSKIKA